MTRWILLVSGACLACGGRSEDKPPPVRDSAAVTAATPAPVRTDSGTAAPAANAKASCPLWGNWQPCSVEERLASAGLVVTPRKDPVRQPFLHVPGTVYDESKAEIQVYLYSSAADRAKDTDVLDTTTVSPRGTSVIWKEPATLVVSNNLAAIILSVNGRQTERIALALGAGMPLHPPGR